MNSGQDIQEINTLMSGLFTLQQLLTCCSKSSLSVNAAVDASQFKPDVSRRRPGRLTVVALSRLVYRKGIDLLVVIIPEMCYRHPQVDFVIGRARAVMTGHAFQALGRLVDQEDIFLFVSPLCVCVFA